MTATKERTDLPFAAIPLLFGIQQLIEGVIWLSFRYDASELNTAMTFAYSLFAFSLWPIFVPFALRLLETEPWRRRVLSLFQVVGIVVGGYLLYSHARSSVTSQVVNSSIVYNNSHFYDFGVIGFYFAATIVSCLFSSKRIAIVFGVVAFISALTAYLVWAVSFVSVWCFFAAILSLMIYTSFRRMPFAWQKRTA